MLARIKACDDFSETLDETTRTCHRIYSVLVKEFPQSEQLLGNIGLGGTAFYVQTVHRTGVGTSARYPVAIRRNTLIKVKSYQLRSFDIGDDVLLSGLTAETGSAHPDALFTALAIRSAPK